MTALALPSPARTGRTGLLLLNLGTPDAPDTASVRRYLRQFLSDPRVIDLSAAGRWALVNLIILPFRPRKSAEAYRQIWTPEGSPLLLHSLALRDRMRERLGDGWRVELAMRYGRPSIESALLELARQEVDRIVVAPLYPQYSSATTGSTLEEVFRVARTLQNVPSMSTLDAFYDDAGYIESFAARGRPMLESMRPDHVLFSFHGVPERQVLKADDSGSHCLRSDTCCAQMSLANRFCYRAQCFETARRLSAALELPEDRWSVSFQSRLGRTPWIQPYTDVVIDHLLERGVRRLLVYSPAFVADCLETIEELGLRLREAFVEKGGEQLEVVPSLNSEPDWVEALARLVSRYGLSGSASSASSVERISPRS